MAMNFVFNIIWFSAKSFKKRPNDESIMALKFFARLSPDGSQARQNVHLLLLHIKTLQQSCSLRKCVRLIFHKTRFYPTYIYTQVSYLVSGRDETAEETKRNKNLQKVEKNAFKLTDKWHEDNNYNQRGSKNTENWPCICKRKGKLVLQKVPNVK